jgi:hypothetical protein
MYRKQSRDSRKGPRLGGDPPPPPLHALKQSRDSRKLAQARAAAATVWWAQATRSNQEIVESAFSVSLFNVNVEFLKKQSRDSRKVARAILDVQADDVHREAIKR